MVLLPLPGMPLCLNLALEIGNKLNEILRRTYILGKQKQWGAWHQWVLEDLSRVGALPLFQLLLLKNVACHAVTLGLQQGAQMVLQQRLSLPWLDMFGQDRAALPSPCLHLGEQELFVQGPQVHFQAFPCMLRALWAPALHTGPGLQTGTGSVGALPGSLGVVIAFSGIASNLRGAATVARQAVLLHQFFQVPPGRLPEVRAQHSLAPRQP